MRFILKINVVLRMCIYNWTNNQEAFYHLDPSVASTSLSHTANWTLRIEGKVLDNPRQSQLPPSISSRKFTDFFTRIYVQLDKDLYPQDGEAEVYLHQF